MKRKQIMEKSLQDYKAYLERLLKNKSETIFTNSGKEHASILMSMLVSNTDRQVRMYATGLKPELITTSPYFEEFKRLFTDNRSINSVKILVETTDYIKERPFQIVQNALIENKDNNNSSKQIEVRRITEECKNIIKRTLDLSSCNFAVFDDNMFRLEYEPTQYKAFASFNHLEMSSKLSELFDTAFSDGQIVEMNN